MTEPADPRAGTSAIHVRRANAEDALALAGLSAELGYPAHEDEFAVRLSRLIARTDHAVLVAERSPGGIVGWIHIVDQDVLEYGRLGEILGLVVSVNTRRLGVGRRLVLAAEQWTASRGLNLISVRSNIVRVESHPFYEQLGYARVKTQHAYRKAL